MKTIETNQLLDCGHPESEHSEFTSGYGTDKDGKKHCYACCAKHDVEQMERDGKIALYLTTKPLPGPTYSHGNYGDCTITNWPGSLKFVGRFHKGRHNMAGTRCDVWFVAQGKNWHGVQYGENTQIVHCKRIKS